MKIAICASMVFSKNIIEIQKDLEKLGHQVAIPKNVGEYAGGEQNPETHIELANKKIDHDLIRNYFREIGSSDAVLVLNISKNGTENYIGGNSFLEMGFAHVQDKLIFLLNPIPKMQYTDEIIAMKPVVINGDLSLIK